MSAVSQQRLFRANTPRALTTFLICLFASVIEGFDIQALAASSPTLTHLFGLTKLQLGMLFSITNIGMVGGAIFGGSLADRYGSKRVFVAAVTLFGASTCAVAGATSFEMLAAARFVAGLGFGASVPITVLMALDVCAPGRRSMVTTMALCGQPAGGIMAIGLATLPASTLGWRGLFVVGGVAALGLAGVAAALLRRQPSAARRADEARPVSPSWGRILFREHRGGATLLLWILFACSFMINWVFITWLPLLIVGKGVAVIVGQRALLVYGVGGIAGALVSGRLVDRLGYKRVLPAAFLLMVAFLLCLAAAKNPASILLASALAGACSLGSGFSLFGLAASFYPLNGRGVGVGATTAVGRITSVVAPFAVGGMLAAGVSATRVLLLVALAALLAASAIWILSRSGRRGDQDESSVAAPAE